ncbi:conserved hypothetical protein [Verrucomicrobia bacterium]|nr:conserved hypothetical protein [Verrucomicrobiota bacterium]
MLLALSVGAAERKFEFGEVPENQTPPGFRSAVTGKGKPGDWKMIMDDVPPLLPRLSVSSTVVTKEPVLAQLSQDPTDEHFPLLIFEGDIYGDFTLTTRFKTVSGSVERMAGIAFRVRDETNYYVVRASSLGNTFRFYKVLNGERGPLVGPELPIPSGVWHDLTVECKTNQIRCLLNGKELIAVTDRVNPLTSGKIAFWTKSDSVSYFADTKIVYKPREAPAQGLVNELAKKYSHLLGLRIYVAGSSPQSTRLAASKDESEVGQPGGKTEQNVISKGGTYYAKGKGSVTVTMPLRDRNGELLAAVCVVMKSFVGETEQTAVVRAGTVVKDIQRRVSSLEDLVE